MSRVDLDRLGGKALEYGEDLDSDHPGFLDAAYRERRKDIVQAGRAHHHGQESPVVEYTKDENRTWAVAYEKLRNAAKDHAVAAFNTHLTEMEKECGYASGAVPQQKDVSAYLTSRTGFQLRPVTGLLSPRDFLNALALKVFFSTQYIRHPSRPLYTPEPDVIHELVGHAPMLADPDFAEMSQTIGLASLGASEPQIQRLATLYWFTVEFGLCTEGAQRKAFGAGVLSSVAEMFHGCLRSLPEATLAAREMSPSERHRMLVGSSGWAAGLGMKDAPTPKVHPLDAETASQQPYPITTLQPVYFEAESLSSAKAELRAFSSRLPPRGFDPTFEAVSERIVCTGEKVCREAYLP